MWQSETHSGGWAQTLVSNFVNMNQTSSVTWALIWSAPYPDFVDGGSGIFFAFEPWSGHYVLEPAGPIQWADLWTVAHTTQFAQPGWKYVMGNARGNLTGGGAYLTLVSDDSASDFTMLLQTDGVSSCTAGVIAPLQQVTVEFQPRWCPNGCQLQLWTSNASAHFVQLSPVTLPPAVGSALRNINLTLMKLAVYTLSTINTAKKGRHPPPPPRKAFPMPYKTGFEGLSNDSMAPYVCDQSGSFSVEVGAGRGSGNALKQRVTRDPTIGNGWIYDQDPVTIVGSHNWSDYSASVDFSFVSEPVNTTETVPTAASLEPCQNGWMDRWAVQCSGGTTGCQISQNGTTCLGAIGCGTSNVRLVTMLCGAAAADKSCHEFDMIEQTGSNVGKFELKHKSSGLCVSEVVQLESASLQTRSRESEEVAGLTTCSSTPGNPQLWEHDKSGTLKSTASGFCLSTKMRYAQLSPVYASICSRFYYSWFSSSNRGICLEAYMNGSYIVRAAPNLAIGAAPSGAPRR